MFADWGVLGAGSKAVILLGSAACKAGQANYEACCEQSVPEVSNHPESLSGIKARREQSSKFAEGAAPVDGCPAPNFWSILYLSE